MDIKRNMLINFLTIYKDWKYKMNSDLFILIGGTVGTGKSALALEICNALDETFSQNMKSRIVFNTGQLQLFENFIQSKKDELEEWVEKPDVIPKPPMKAFQIDEGQNILYRRNATTKINKKLIQDIKTMRYLNSICVFCIPDPNTIDNDLLNRFDMLIIPEVKGDGRYSHIWINQLGQYSGRFNYFFQKIQEKQKEGIRLRFDVQQLYGQNIPLSDCMGKIPYHRKLYQEYEKLKISSSFVRDSDDNNTDKTESNTISKPIIEILDGGNGDIVDVPDGKLYKNNFYSYKVIAQALGKSVGGIRNKAADVGARKMKKGNKVYVLLKDILAA